MERTLEPVDIPLVEGDAPNAASATAQPPLRQADLPPQTPAQAPLFISVVIPTYRRPALLQRCLQPLLHQTMDASRYEVIVVDDGQTDDTRALVEALASQSQGRPSIRYVRPEGTRGPAAARNAGWAAASGEVIAFTDDDTVPDADWLLQGWRAIGGAGGRSHPAVRGAVKVPLADDISDHARMTQGLENAEFVTANCFVRREALRRVGGFDERFQRAWREDSDLQFKLIDAYGVEIGKAPWARVEHPVREAAFGISMKQQANMMFDALLFKKHPRLYREKVGRVHAPPSYYVIVGSTFAALGMAAGGKFGVAATLGVVALGFIGALALRRLRGTTRTRAHVVEMIVTSAAIPFLSLYWRLRGAWRFRVPFF